MNIIFMTTHRFPSLATLGSVSMSCRMIVGGANVELGVRFDGATLAMEEFFPFTSCSQREKDKYARTFGTGAIRLEHCSRTGSAVTSQSHCVSE